MMLFLTCVPVNNQFTFTSLSDKLAKTINSKLLFSS